MRKAIAFAGDRAEVAAAECGASGARSVSTVQGPGGAFTRDARTAYGAEPARRGRRARPQRSKPGNRRVLTEGCSSPFYRVPCLAVRAVAPPGVSARSSRAAVRLAVLLPSVRKGA